MSNFGTMINRVLDDIHRQGELTSQASDAIKTAIKFYDGKVFWFNRQRATTNTVNAQEFYALPSDFVDEDSLVINVNNYTYRLNKKHYTTIEDLYVNATTYTGYPQDYAIYAEQIRLYPIPNDVYIMTLSYTKQLDALSADADTNAWMVEGEELIRSRAAADLCLRVLQDKERGAIFKGLEKESFDTIKSETNRRLTTGHTKKRSFSYARI